MINKQCLFELEISRKREKMRHIKTGHVYQWPSEKMVTHITKLGCNLVPVGLHNKDKSRNPDSSIEWEVMFTKAEQYMTRNLHHPKVRVYLFSLLMLKCHFEKFDGLRQVNNPLDILDTYQRIFFISYLFIFHRESHIRHALYWLLEKNPVDWTEENVGEKFMDLWDTMKKRLSKQHMPNFFIQRSNMFSNVPQSRLR